MPGKPLPRHSVKWRAVISSEGRQICLGQFGTKEEAAHAYDEAAKKYHGEFAYVNFA
jgi:AP2 domain